LKPEETIMAKKSPAGIAIQRLTISGSAVSFPRVEAAIRSAESLLAEGGRLAAGATLLRVDLDQRGNVTSISFEGDASLSREAGNLLRKGRSRIRIGSTTVSAASALLQE
jgi:hypothetical protein